MFTYATKIRLYDTDAAGVIFFANQFRLAHEAFEAFLDSKGLGLRHPLEEQGPMLPIARAEASFDEPLRVGDEVNIEITAERVGSSAFTLLYRFVAPAGTQYGTARIVHVCIDAEAWEKAPLPEAIKQVLKTLAAPSKV